MPKGFEQARAVFSKEGPVQVLKAHVINLDLIDIIGSEAWFWRSTHNYRFMSSFDERLGQKLYTSFGPSDNVRLIEGVDHQNFQEITHSLHGIHEAGWPTSVAESRTIDKTSALHGTSIGT